MGEPTQTEKLTALASIDDPARRALFDYVSKSVSAVGRDEAATAVNLPRTSAAFHLDRLVEAGLLVTEFARRSGRTGPGAGRPAKLYRIARAELNVAYPERHYDLMGDVLAAAIDTADQTGEGVRIALDDEARRKGKELGETAESFAQLIESVGYEPQDAGDGSIILTNCPFHRLAASHTSIICQANVALLEGAAEGVGGCEHAISFDPSAGHCCVRLTPRQS